MSARDSRVTLERDGRSAVVTLDRPHKRNSIDLGMLEGFEEVLQELHQDAEVDVVVLTGSGPAFCAGTDLGDLETLDPAATLHIQRRTAAIVERWYRMEKTTITAFNGPAIGSGAVLGLASDLRVAADSCFFAFPEVGFGIPLTWSGMTILAGLVGADRANRWLLLGQRVEPPEMLELELVIEVTSPADLDGAVERLRAALLASSPVARAMTKHAAHLAGPRFDASAGDAYLAALSIAMRDHGRWRQESEAPRKRAPKQGS